MEKYINKRIEAISKLLGSNVLLSLKVLFPKDSSLSILNSILVLHKDIDRTKYNRLDEHYVSDGKNDSEVRKTLTFQKYNQNLKYQNIKRKATSIPLHNDNDNNYDIKTESEIHINDKKKWENKTAKQINLWWKDWGDSIQAQFCYGRSTLWSYVLLRSDKDEEFIASSYAIFSRELKRNEKILTNKYCQDLLVQLIAMQYSKEIIQQATRASIAQVMARNTSHNIGAHVMNKLTNNLKNIDLFKAENLEKQGKYQSTSLKALYNNKKEIECRDIIFDQIAVFNNYVKCRMDYLADIALGTPLMQTNKYAYQDLFKDLDKVRLLLEYISGLSNFKYKIVFKHNGGDTIKSNDLLVALPNDILGQQAFYNILENIIRNTAKHSGAEGERTFTVNFIDNDSSQKEILKDYIAIEIYDDVNVEWRDGEQEAAKKKEKSIEDKNKENNTNEPCLKEEDIKEKIDYLVYCQNRIINDDILKDNNLRHHSLGMIEMDASAAYLRKEDVVLTNSSDYDITLTSDSWQSEKGKPYFLKAFRKTDKDKNYLGYRFFLLRPALALVVTDETEYWCKETESSSLTEEKKLTQAKNELNKNGILILTEEELKENFAKKEPKSFPHQFVISKKSEEEFWGLNCEQQKCKDKTLLPTKWVQDKANVFSDILKAETFDKEVFEAKVWETIYQEKKLFCTVNKFNICSYDGIKNNQKIEMQANTLVIPDHLSIDKNGVDNYNTCCCQIKNNSLLNSWVEPLGSNAQSKLPFFIKCGTLSNYYQNKYFNTDDSLISLSDDEIFIKRSRLFDAYFSKVYVLDERVQNHSEINRDSTDIQNFQIFKYSNVLIPEKKTFDLAGNSIKNIFKSIEEKEVQNDAYKINIDTEISNFQFDDFLLIHFGILERIYSDKKDIRQALAKWGKKTNVVVTSGRGRQSLIDYLPENVRFVNLSSVINAFVDNQNKYLIHYILNQSRR